MPDEFPSPNGVCTIGLCERRQKRRLGQKPRALLWVQSYPAVGRCGGSAVKLNDLGRRVGIRSGKKRDEISRSAEESPFYECLGLLSKERTQAPRETRECDDVLLHVLHVCQMQPLGEELGQAILGCGCRCGHKTLGLGRLLLRRSKGVLL